MPNRLPELPGKWTQIRKSWRKRHRTGAKPPREHSRSVGRPAPTLRLMVVLAVGLSTVRCGEPRGTTVRPRARAGGVFSSAGTLVEQLGDRVFKLHDGPAPPADVSERMDLPFPPPRRPATGPDPAKAPRLKVLRHHPKGKIGKHNAVTVTFNQPMIPLASLQDLRTLPKPLLLKPKVKGRYRWLGTRTLAYEVTERLPFSTPYTARVPAGIVAESGKKLEKEVRWKFETPRLDIERVYPSGRHVVPSTPFALRFNQRIDAEKVFAALRLTTSKGAVKLQRIPRERWKKIGSVGATALKWEKGRVLVVKPRRTLKKGTRYYLRVKKGVAAGEGPLPTRKELRKWFQTYGPLKVKRLRCGHRNRVCRPSTNKWLQFTNSIQGDQETVKRQIRLRPRVKDLEVRCGGSRCYLRGTFEPQTRYRVTVRPDLQDVYDQRLGKRWTGSFFVGDAYPVLQLPVRGAHAVTEHKGNRTLRVTSINVKRVTARFVRLKPNQVPQVLQLLRRRGYRRYREGTMTKDVPGTPVVKKLTLNRRANRWRTAGLSLATGLPGKKPGLVFVELHAPDLKKISRYANPYRRLLVQVTDLGITARYDTDRVLALVTGLQSGAPIPDAPVRLVTDGGKTLWRGKTDANGLAEAPGARALKRKGPLTIVAQKGDDAAAARIRNWGQAGHTSGYSRHGRMPAKQRLRGYLHTERNPYRPGETVHLRGVLRVEEVTPRGGIEPLTGSNVRVRWSLRDARRKLVKKQQVVKVDADGSFSITYQIPPEAALGYYRFRGQVLGSPVGTATLYHQFRVLEYRTPEYKVKVETRGEPYFFGDALQGTVKGAYFYGTAMADAPVKWTLRRAVGAYRPPGSSGFRFGELRDWAWRWRLRRGRRGGRYGTYHTSGHTRSQIVGRGQGKLDSDGLLRLQTKLPFWKKGHGPGTVGAFTLEAQVFDKNRQSIAGRKTVTVHPAAVYVGLRMKKALVKAGQDSEVQVVVTDLAGKRRAGHRVRVVATRQVYRRKAEKKEGQWRYRYTLTEQKVGGCTVTTAAKVQGCQIRLPRAGYYRLRAEAQDKTGRRTRTVLGVYAVGKKWQPWKQDNKNRLELVLDRKAYEPGDTAKVLIKSPFRRAVGLLTVERNGIKSHRVIRTRGAMHVERVRLETTDPPNVRVSVALVRGRVRVPGAAAGTDLGRPRYAHGTRQVPVSVDAKRLRVAVAAEPGTARPGATTQVRVTVKDAQGRPVKARLAVMAVDEGVLSLLGFSVPDPVSVMHAHKSGRAVLRTLRHDLIKQEKNLKKVRSQGQRKERSAQRRARRLSDNKVLDSTGRGGGALGGAATGAVARRPADTTLAAEAPTGGKKAGPGARGPQSLVFKTRSRFAATAFYDDTVRTGPDGVAQLGVKLPDNLTTFRITAVALDRVQRDRFGKGEGRVTVRRPLMLMPALPRFANFGDRFEAGVKVTNETGKKGVVTVKIQMTNAKALEPTVKRIPVEAGQTEEVRFEVAIGKPGRARFRFLAHLGQETDAVVVPLPVNLPATTEAFATYGVTDSSVSQPVLPPKDALTQFGGLDLSFSSTALTGMEDAVSYLINYPWECTEQLASRLMPIVALRKILPAFQLLGRKTEEGSEYAVKVPERFLKARKGVSRAEIERQYLEWLARTGIAKLVSYQRYDGGFGYWGGARLSWPYPTAYATYALLRAKEAGYDVPERTLSKAARWLSNFLRYRHWWRRYHWRYSWTMRAMAAWVLTEMADADQLSSYVRKRLELKRHLGLIYASKEKLPLFGKAMLMTAIHRVEGRSGKVRELLKILDNAAIQDTPYKVHFREQVTESLRLLMHSESRTDAIVLQALMEVQPDYPLVAKIVRGLVSARVRGRWENTQANAYALVALSRYYKRYEKQVPDFRLRAWLGDGYIGQTRFEGRSMRVVESKVPMAFLKAQGRKPLLLEKKGQGKLYYRLGLRYAPKSLRLPPEEQGFSVTRRYEPVERASDVVRRKNGRYRIKAGAYVRVRLRVVVPSRRYFVAVDDPLPAGLEAVDTNLRTSASSTLAGKAQHKIYDFRSWYALFAFSHKEKRDDRVVLFSDRLPSGVYEYTYLARATTIGTFVVPPLKASEMYHPEVFGRNGTQFVQVVE